MTRPRRVDDLAGRDVQRREQIGHTVTHVVMRASLDLSGTHRQRRLRAIQRLDAGLLIDAQDHRMFRRVHVEPDHITDLLDELRVFGQLERVDQPWLQPERLPDPTHRRRRHPDPLGEITRRPMRRVGRLVFQGPDDHTLNIIVGDRPRCPRTGFVHQPIEAPLDEPSPPLRDRRLIHVQLRRDHHVVRALRALQHDPAPLRQRMRRLRTPRPTSQRLTFLIGERQHLLRTTPTSHTSQYEPSSSITRAIPDAGH